MLVTGEAQGSAKAMNTMQCFQPLICLDRVRLDVQLSHFIPSSMSDDKNELNIRSKILRCTILP